MERQQFPEWVKDALAHLYDFAYLRQHPLLNLLVPRTDERALDRVLRLRQQLQQAIESLAPTADLPPTAKGWRPYLALRYYYVDNLELREVEKRLGLGDRQVLRERNRGLQAVASLLWEQRILPPPNAKSEGSGVGADDAQLAPELPVSRELEELGVEYVQIRVPELLENACQSVSGLATQHSVSIDCQPTDPSLTVLADMTLLRQTIIAAVSLAISAGPAGPIQVRTDLADGNLRLSVLWSPSERDEAPPKLATIRALAAAQKGQCSLESIGGLTTLQLSIPQPRDLCILLIEDNASALQLYRRYLGQHNYRLLCTQEGPEGLELARQEHPDLIVLDVMMRGMDGWMVLQELKAQPATQDIPVIVCSVLPESTLALSLGAEAFLPKPISRFALLDAIRSCLDRSRNGEPPPPETP